MKKFPEPRPDGDPDLSQILRLPHKAESPGGEALPLRPWMHLCLSRLSRPRNHPAVLRHTKMRTEEQIGSSGSRRLQEKVEVRRRAREMYSAVPVPLGPERSRIFLDADASLIECRLERRRILRQTSTLVVYDEVYVYESVLVPSIEHLRCLQQACVEQSLAELYQLWPQLDQGQQEQLVSFPAPWAAVRLALEGAGATPGQVEALPLLLSERAHPELRMEVLEAGERGEFRPVPEALPLLLAQPQWNQSPALVAMARSASECPLASLTALQSHPNPLVRARLVELMPIDLDWVGWLATESDATVREAIRRAVERRMNPHELVDSLIGPPSLLPSFGARKHADPRRAEALGWLLIGWSKKLEHSQDWRALNRALSSPMGAENRQKLKQKLSASGQLSLASNLLH